MPLAMLNRSNHTTHDDLPIKLGFQNTGFIFFRNVANIHRRQLVFEAQVEQRIHPPANKQHKDLRVQIYQ